MPKAVTVRPLSTRDVEDYRIIRLSALRTAPEAFGSTYAVEASRPVEEHAGRLSSSVVFGAYAGDRIVGMIGLKQETGPKMVHKGFLWGFYVAPGHRGTGAGADLLTAVLEAARSLVEQVRLTVVVGNVAALTLYERFGFIRYGVEPRALKTAAGYVDEVLMVRFLDRSEREV